MIRTSSSLSGSILPTSPRIFPGATALMEAFPSGSILSAVMRCRDSLNPSRPTSSVSFS